MRTEHWLYTIPQRLRSLFRWAQADKELDDELRDHLELKAEEYAAQGMTPGEAQRRARLDLGGIEQTKEKCRDARKVNWIQDLVQDLHFGLRMLRKSPGFTAVAVLTLALGIGANTAIFTLTDQILLRDLPVPHAERLVILRSPGPNHGHTWGDVDQGAQSFSYPMYKDLRERVTVFSRSAGMPQDFGERFRLRGDADRACRLGQRQFLPDVGSGACAWPPVYPGR